LVLFLVLRLLRHATPRHCRSLYRTFRCRAYLTVGAFAVTHRLPVLLPNCCDPGTYRELPTRTHYRCPVTLFFNAAALAGRLPGWRTLFSHTLYLLPPRDVLPAFPSACVRSYRCPLPRYPATPACLLTFPHYRWGRRTGARGCQFCSYRRIRSTRADGYRWLHTFPLRLVFAALPGFCGMAVTQGACHLPHTYATCCWFSTPSAPHPPPLLRIPCLGWFG